MLNKTHLSDTSDITLCNDVSMLSVNGTCISHFKAELVLSRSSGSIFDHAPGMGNYMHAQFIDANACKLISELWWDVSYCNSTGVYSDVLGNSDEDVKHLSNFDNMALCGRQRTEENGIASNRSLFPEHYSGRDTHSHDVSAVDKSLLRHGTIAGGSISQIGQLFLGDDLIADVESTYPYDTNDVGTILNSVDHIFVV